MMSESYQPVPQEEAEGQTTLEPLYQIVLFDDDDHTYAYVVQMMTTLFKKSQQEAFEVAYEVDYIGQAVVDILPYEDAVNGAEAIMCFGPDASVAACSSSMKAAVIPAEE